MVGRDLFLNTVAINQAEWTGTHRLRLAATGIIHHPSSSTELFFSFFPPPHQDSSLSVLNQHIQSVCIHLILCLIFFWLSSSAPKEKTKSMLGFKEEEEKKKPGGQPKGNACWPPLLKWRVHEDSSTHSPWLSSTPPPNTHTHSPPTATSWPSSTA